MDKLKFYIYLAGAIVAVILLCPGNKTEKKQEVQVTKAEVKKRVKKIVTIVEKPDGTKKTVIREDTATDSNVQASVRNSVVNEVGKKNPTRISVMTGYAISDQSLVYGVSITKPVLGPFSIGVWGLTNKTFGASVGVDL